MKVVGFRVAKNLKSSIGEEKKYYYYYVLNSFQFTTMVNFFYYIFLFLILFYLATYGRQYQLTLAFVKINRVSKGIYLTNKNLLD